MNFTICQWNHGFADTETYSIHNGGRSAVAERFIRTLKNKVFKYMTPTLKKLCINKLVDIVNKYNNICHRAIKLKSLLM